MNYKWNQWILLLVMAAAICAAGCQKRVISPYGRTARYGADSEQAHQASGATRTGDPAAAGKGSYQDSLNIEDGVAQNTDSGNLSEDDGFMQLPGRSDSVETIPPPDQPGTGGNLDQIDAPYQKPYKKPMQIGSPPEKAGAPVLAHNVPVVDRLIARAEQQLAADQPHEAFVTAERAIRIDAGDARLWQLMARIQLKRGNPDQAEQLAMRSNLHAGANLALRAENWRIIAQVCQLKGDTRAAARAMQRVSELENGDQ